MNRPDVHRSSLPKAAHKLSEEKLRSWEYGSADEVVHAALEALNEREAHSLDDATLDAIDRAEEQIERGQVREWKHVRAKSLGR